MTNDENEKARELINSAFADAQPLGEAINSPTDLARAIARKLRDQKQFVKALLKEGDSAALMEIVVTEHTQPTDTERGTGALSIQVLAKIDNSTPALLHRLANTTNATAYATATASTIDGETGLVLVMATPQHCLFAVATDEGEAGYTLGECEADTDHPVPTDLRELVLALQAAAKRTANK